MRIPCEASKIDTLLHTFDGRADLKLALAEHVVDELGKIHTPQTLALMRALAMLDDLDPDAPKTVPDAIGRATGGVRRLGPGIYVAAL